ncbi:extended synaptotagmin-2 [Coccinella septempunctata]|uniref:extended synaptotagmin-2 n=1 Tax=Coccinella septempunctata TaxID=41139 RepID=UPI001D083439|nr:extended synaptotagmin-2 [Coccinella septempunctata]
MSVSKEAAAAVAKKTSNEFNIASFAYSAFKKIATVGCIYFFGYMNWSVGWFVAPIIFLIMREQWKEAADTKRNIAKTAALSNERDVVLARLDELPAWVFFPDVERVEWLNRIIQQVWPNVNNYTRELIRDTIQPIIQESLEAYKMKGFKFERIILGSIPVRIGGVKVYDKNTDRNEIIMDLDVFYAGDCDITFYVAGIKGGIKDLQLKGMMRVVMKPLISSIPLVGGVQVFFLNNPEIDFNLVGVADLLDMPGLGDLFRKVITEIIASMLVLPNKYSMKLSEEVETIDVKAPEPEGVLRVHVVEAKHLMKKDLGVLGGGKSDPYAVITVGAQEYKTGVVKNSLDPKWDYWCEFVITEVYGQQLFIHLWDLDDALDDENLGRATVDISNIVKQEQADMWLTLENAKHGMVHLRFTWLSLSNNVNDLKAALIEAQLLGTEKVSTALLCVFVDSARNLPLARQSSQPDPYAVLRLGNSTKQTQIIMRNPEPVWEEGFVFRVQNPNNDILHLRIVDKKTGHDIGSLEYSIKNLLNKDSMAVNKEPFRLQKSGTDSRIIWSLSLKILKLSGLTHESLAEQNNEPVVIVDEKSPLLAQTSNSSGASRSPERSPTRTLPKQSSIESWQEDRIDDSSVHLESSVPINDTSCDRIIHRNPSQTSSSGDAGLGRLQLTLQYSTQRQKLVVIVHKIAHIPQRDPSNIPDPYVKLYLLPGRSKESKRKTATIKDNCNPVFEESFEYLISQNELLNKKLEITVCTQKAMFYSSSNILGQVVIDLCKLEIDKSYSSWFDLQPEYSHE